MEHLNSEVTLIIVIFLLHSCFGSFIHKEHFPVATVQFDCLGLLFELLNMWLYVRDYRTINLGKITSDTILEHAVTLKRARGAALGRTTDKTTLYLCQPLSCFQSSDTTD